MMDEETAAIMELQAMSKDELLKVDHDTVKWHCCIEGCDRFTRLLDFGISPIFYFRGRWLNIYQRIWICGKHYKLLKNTSEYDWPKKQPDSWLDLIDLKTKK